MKKRLLIGITILLCFSMLAGCAGTQENNEHTGPGSSLTDSTLAYYTKLVSFKTDGYEQQSVKAFNASLVPEFGELLEAMAAITAVGLSPEDENYDFITMTLDASLRELYAEQMNEEAFYTGHVVKSCLSEPLNKEEEAIFEAEGPIYDFYFTADYYLEYEIISPDILKISERDNAFRVFGAELQAYVDGLSESELSSKSIEKKLTNRASTILQEIIPNGMTISCEIQILDPLEIQTSNPLTDEELEAIFSDMEVEWWTYDEYKEWLENEKVQLQDMVGETCWTRSRGEFVWTQEMTDEIIKLYEDTLEDIKNGMLYSKTVNGEADRFGMSVNPEDIRMGTSSRELSLSVKLLNGEEVTFGPFATVDDLLVEVEPFCKEQVANGRMTQAEADEILARYRDGSNSQ